jgi:hypothetical protein
MITMLAAALAYARAGLAVFPAPPGSKMSYKAARNYGGVRWGATRDEAEIRSDWARWPDANIGLPTGRDNKIFVVETDTAAHGVDGEATLRVWTSQQGKFPLTRQAISPSGSRHYYFTYPPSGLEVKNDTGKILGAGVDIRGEGGMVIAPPSIRSDGSYKWVVNEPPAKAPYWLIQLVSSEVRRTRRNSVDDDYGALHPDYVAATVEAIPTALDWHSRNNVGMAIFNATNGSSRGFAIWDKWLQRSGKYSVNATRQRWRKMRSSPPSNIGYGTLHHLAMRNSPEWLSELDRKLIAKMEQNYQNVEYEDD